MVATFEIGIIFFFALLGGVLAVRFKQPTVLGLLLVGALIGPHAFGLVTDTVIIEAVIEVGAILLLFIVGIEFSAEKLFGLGIKPLLIASLKLAIVFFGGYQAALFFGLSGISALYVGVILAITSTVIVVRILEQKGMAKREELPLLIAILIIEDIFAVFALTFFSSLDAAAVAAPIKLFSSLFLSIGYMCIAYFVLLKIIKKIMKWFLLYSAEDTFTFLSLGLCAGMSYFAHILHLSPSVGAFLAGSMLAALPEAKRFEHAVHPFILTCTSLFFLSIGTLINSASLFTSWFLIIILLLVNLFFKYGSIVVGTYLGGDSGKKAVFSGIAMLSVGEFSLLIAKEASRIDTGIDFVSVTAAIIVLSTIVMSILVSREEKVHDFTKKALPKRVLEDLHYLAKYIHAISLKMLVERIEVNKITADWKGIFRNIMIITSIIVTGALLWIYLPKEFVKELVLNKTLLYILIASAIIALSISSFKIYKYLRDLVHCVENIFITITPTKEENEKKIVHSIFIIGALLLLSFICSNVLLLLHAPHEFHIIPGGLVVVSIIYGVHTFSLIHSCFKDKKENHKKALLKSKLF